MKYLILICPLLFLSCNKNNELEKLRKQIIFFEDNKLLFNNFSVTPLRGDQLNPNPLEFMVQRHNISNKAFIQTKPELKILENFIKDSIDFNFLNAFNSLNCRFLCVAEKFVEIENIEKEYKTFLFKGDSNDYEKDLKREDYSIQYIDNWRIYKIKRQKN